MADYPPDSIELEPSAGPVSRPADRRPRMFEPLPVRLLTVEDARLAAVAGLETDLDDFYVGLLKCERVREGEDLAYRADNFRILFTVVERPAPREDMRPLALEIPSLADVQRELDALDIEYTWQKSLVPGQEVLLLTDPSGNWIELHQASILR